MTLFEWFISLPLLLRIIIGIPIAIFAVESFIMPFKFNLWYNRYKDTLKLLESILEASKANTKNLKDTQQVISLILGLYGSKNKKDERNKHD